MTIRYQCICMWSWTEMLFFFFPVKSSGRVKHSPSVWTSYGMALCTYQSIYVVYQSASYEYRKMSASRGAQFVPIGMPTICLKTFAPKTMVSQVWLLSRFAYFYRRYCPLLIYRLEIWYMNLSLRHTNHVRLLLHFILFGTNYWHALVCISTKLTCIIFYFKWHQWPCDLEYNLCI